MTIPFPSVNIARSELVIERFQGVSRSPYGGQSQRVDYGAAIAFQLTFVPTTAEQANALEAFLETDDDFFFSPVGYPPFATGKGTARINGAGQAGTSIATDGWSGSQVVLGHGQWLQIGNQLCRTRSDIVSVSGSATLLLTRPLHASPADNALIDYETPQGLFRIQEATRTASKVPLFTYTSVVIEEVF